jgi:hypothetical protein
MDWQVTKTEGPLKHAKEWRSGDVIIRTGITRGLYPMTKWRVIYPDGKEASCRSLEAAKEHAENNAARHATTT